MTWTVPTTDDVADRGGAATRARILDAATELFYAQGIRGTSADRIIEQVGLTKVTFYRYFRTKNDLVVAYLERQVGMESRMLSEAREGVSAAQAVQTIAANIGTASCLPGFRGCPFINAAAEFPDANDPVRVVVDGHRRWTRDLFRAIAGDAGLPDAEAAADHLMMLRDGAMVGGYLGDPQAIPDMLARAFLAVIEGPSAAPTTRTGEPG